MYQVEDKPETIHLYVVREEAARPSVVPIILSLLGLSLLLTLGIAIPYTQPVTRLAIRVSAVPLGIKSFSASVVIIPTGVKTYPATTAHGVLTITNGSIIAQVIPAGFTVQGVTTDSAVYVPAGNADGYGKAAVPAHAVMSGNAGNLPALAINQVIGSSVYIRNLGAFMGGQDSYSVKYVTEQDKVDALQRARYLLAAMVSGLHYPCNEVHKAATKIEVTWRCEFVTYHLPQHTHPINVTVIGNSILLSVWFYEQPKQIWVK